MNLDNVLILSGCGWNDSGGAQRPVQFARRLAKAGVKVWFLSDLDPVARTSGEGVHIVGKDCWPETEFPSSGLVIAALPSYGNMAKRFYRRGWSVMYDLLDDWQAFVKAGIHEPQLLEPEAELLECCAGAIGSAPLLVDYLQGKGLKHVELIGNGGPEAPIARAHMSWPRTRAMLSSYLFGQWLDWRALTWASAPDDVEVEIIGKHTCEREGSVLDRCPEARFLGELPHELALQVMAGRDAGLIPFQGDLCRGVDPIKYYDHLATGMWTVYTPDLWPMVGRPYALMATAEQFPDAIRQAAALTAKDPPQAHLVVENSWACRTKALIEFVHRLPDRTHAAVTKAWRAPYPKQGLISKDCGLRVTLSIPSTCQNDRLGKTCVYCCNAHVRRNRPALYGSASQWERGLSRLAEEHGPCYFSFCYGDALSDAETLGIAAGLAEQNKVDLVTNMQCSLEDLAVIPRNGNTALATSFHPHAWPGGFSAFLEARERIIESGLHCGIVSVVGWPPYLNSLPKWRDEGLDWNVRLYVVPFGGQYRGKQYPFSYTPDEWEVVKQADLYHYDMTGYNWGGQHSPKGLPCRVGMRDTYIFVKPNGDVDRCYMACKDAPIGNVLRSSPIRFLEAPQPCPHDTCPCADMWQFIEVPPQDSRVLRPEERPALMMYDRHRRMEIRLAEAAG